MEQIPQIIHQSWNQYLQPLFDDPKMIMIKDMLFGPNKIRFYPEAKQIFRVFEMPITDIKVVCLGQDPYPNGEAIGLAFAVNLGTSFKTPPSLRVIKSEVDNNTTDKFFKKYEDFTWRTLEHWHKQGVFLLNTALTVERGNAGSHLGIWQWFTREVIKIISTLQPCVWMLWGSKAQNFKDYIHHKITVDESIKIRGGNPSNNWNVILEAPHPAAETYPNSKYKFTGCNHFNLCNEILKAKNQSIIKW